VLAADERLCSHGYLASTRRARARAIVASKSAVRHRYCAIIRPSDCDAGGRGTRGAGTGSWLGRVWRSSIRWSGTCCRQTRALRTTPARV